jgi:hypothetical protein
MQKMCPRPSGKLSTGSEAVVLWCGVPYMLAALESLPQGTSDTPSHYWRYSTPTTCPARSLLVSDALQHPALGVLLQLLCSQLRKLLQPGYLLLPLGLALSLALAAAALNGQLLVHERTPERISGTQLQASGLHLAV